MTTITAPPTTPQRLTDTPDQFVTKMDAWLSWEENLPTELNAYFDYMVALVSGIDFNGTSTSSVAIGTGSKAWTTQASKLWQVGQFVIVADSAAPQNYCYGQVTAYSGTTLTVDVTAVGGSGTKTAWSIGLAPVSSAYLTLSGGTMTGALTTATPASGQEALIIPHGAAPSAPTNGSIWSTTAALFARINGATKQLLTTAGGTLTGLLTTTASATGGAGLNLPHGTAPTTPTNGDVWTTTAGAYAQINGTTYSLSNSGIGSGTVVAMQTNQIVL